MIGKGREGKEEELKAFYIGLFNISICLGIRNVLGGERLKQYCLLLYLLAIAIAFFSFFSKLPYIWVKGGKEE